MRSNSAGRPVEAAEDLTAALALLDSSSHTPEPDRLRERGNTLITLALSEFLLDGLRVARERLDQAEAVADQLDDDRLRARVAFQRASILGRAGDLAAALAEMQRAVSAPDAFTAKEQCSVQINRGMLALELAQPQVASEAFAAAARVAHEHGFVQQEQLARHNEGHALFLRGQLPRSLAVMADAERLDGDIPTARVQLDRARVMLEAGLVSDALDLLGSVSAALRGAGNDQVVAEVELARARALRLLGRPEQAMAAATAALTASEHIGSVGWSARARLTLLHLELGAGPAIGGDALRDLARRAADVAATADHLGDAQLARSALLVAAEALLGAGDLDGARTHWQRLSATPPGSLSEDLDSAWFAASLDVSSGEPTSARRRLASAAQRLGAAQSGSASLDLRTAQALHGVRLSALDLELARPGGSARVLASLERWRRATDRFATLDRPRDEELAALTEQLRSVHAQLLADPETRSTQDLARRAATLERQIRSRDWALSTLSSEETSASVEEARAALDRADRDLLWFFTLGDRVHALGIVGGRASIRELMSRSEAQELARRIRVDLRAAATRHLGSMSQAVWASLRSSAEQLDGDLVRPWRAARAGLVLVTCEELSALPWALLPSLADRPLTIARSLTAFARREQTDTSGHAGGAGPRVRVGVGPGIARGPAEGKAVIATWRRSDPRADVASSSRAADLVQALAGRGVVHVAAHGRHQAQSPLFSSVALQDGPVFAHELQPGGVGADHVVLSACEVGTTSYRPGEEQLGLAASMLSLGARSVVAAVAPVPDDVAADAMARHHAGLARGLASDEALAEAVAASEPVAAAFLELGGRWVPGRP